MLKAQTLEFRIKSCIFLSSSLTEILVIVTQSCLTLCNSWTIACQAPLSMEFSSQEYWIGLPFLSPGDLSDPGVEPRSPALQMDFLPSESPGKHNRGLFFLIFSLVLILSKCTCTGSRGKSLPRVPYLVTPFIRDTAGCLKDALVQTLLLPRRIHHAGSGRATAEN